MFLNSHSVISYLPRDNGRVMQNIYEIIVSQEKHKMNYEMNVFPKQGMTIRGKYLVILLNSAYFRH